FLDKETARLKAGDTVLCFIPESGRFTAGYMLWEVEQDAPVDTEQKPFFAQKARAVSPANDALPDVAAIRPPHDPAAAAAALAPLVAELASARQGDRSQVRRTPLLQRMRARPLHAADYVRWMEHWIPQVREGSLWMREGAASRTGDFAARAALIDLHAD